MAFPSSTGTVQDSLAQAWATARNTASSIKGRAQALSTQAAAGSIGSSAILDFATYLADAKIALTKAAQTGGIAAYAQAQINDPNIDIAAEFTAMMGAIDTTTAWVVDNFPKDGSGFLLARSFQAGSTGRTVDRQFTPAQTATLRTALDALADAIN
jgi:hypothetical protein